MPRISAFHGLVILMFVNESVHATPHFHVRYAEHRASVGLDGSLIAGDLPTPQRRLVREWALLHTAELGANWERARAGGPVEPISPLA